MLSPKPQDLFYDIFHLNKNKNSKRHKYLDYAIIFFRELFKHIKNKKINKINAKPGILVIVGTNNHKTVYNRINKYITINKEVWGSQGRKNVSKSPEINDISLLNKLLVLKNIIKHEIHDSEFRKHPISRRYMYQNYVLIEKLANYFNDSKYKAILVFNDHVTWYRCIIYAGKRSRIPVIYIPHASVNNRFPPLIFDLSLLEGNDMLDKYKQCGKISGATTLIGNPKYDSLPKKRSFKKNVINLGIAFNHLEEIPALNSWLNQILLFRDDYASDIKFNIIVRPHPALYVAAIQLIDRKEVEISNPIKVDSIDYLTHINVLLATNSNIILESLMVETPVIHINLDFVKSYDNYKFIEQGIVNPPVSSPFNAMSQVLQMANKNFIISKEVKDKLPYYNAAIGQSWEGNVGKKIGHEIESFLK